MSDMNCLEVILIKQKQWCSPIEILIRIAYRRGLDKMFLEQVAREFDSYQGLRVKAEDVCKNPTERTRELDNLAYALEKLHETLNRKNG